VPKLEQRFQFKVGENSTCLQLKPIDQRGDLFIAGRAERRTRQLVIRGVDQLLCFFVVVHL
jgi:hypothetical protein